MKITGFKTGNHGMQRNLIYAELRNDDGEVIISATIDYILKAIRDRKYTVEEVGYIDPSFGEQG